MSFIGHLVMGLIELVVLIFIWGAVFRETPNFGNYTFPTMLTYLVLAKFFHFATRGNTARLMGDEIKEGELSQYLIKPVSYLKWWFSYTLAERIFEIAVRISIIVSAFCLFPLIFSMPSLNNLLLFLIFIPVALVMNIFINYLIASLAFWVNDVRLFEVFLGLTINFLAGSLMPIDVFPGWLKAISYLLPFQYTMYFPIKIYLGQISTIDGLQGLFVGLTWFFIIALINKVVWKRGLRQYEAVGQ